MKHFLKATSILVILPFYVAFYSLSKKPLDAKTLLIYNLFTPFWKRELDIENIDEISEILVSTGVDITGFEVYVHGSGKQEHDSLQASFHNRGIFGVPTYHFNDEFLFGREHLPYVKWRLTGRLGNAPDIAYPI